jgi:hypothetical protein
MLRVGYRILFYYKKRVYCLCVHLSLAAQRMAIRRIICKLVINGQRLSYEALVFTGLINYVGIIAKFFK